MRLVQRGIANNFGLVGKNLRKYLATTALTATGLMIATSPAFADNWTDHVASEGSITIDTSVPNTTNIKQHTDFAKVSGDGDINAGWTVNLNQNSKNSTYVLYDIENDPTMIMGNLNANGRVYIFDQNGVIFGGDSQVNVGSIVTSTGFISDANIKADKLVFEGVAGNGEIVNNGSITASEGGLAAFVAPGVRNNGIINADVVVGASADKVAIDLYGDNLVSVEVEGELQNAIIENKGTINAAGGTVALTVAAAKDAVDNVINMDGIIDVSSVSVKGGKIILNGGDKGVVKVAGKLKADGKDGGSVKIAGQNIHLTETSEISADATAAGNGGRVDVVAQNGLVFGGTISAKGGALSGNGGYVDTSGLGWVDIYGNVDASAINGTNGTWLIDPTNLTITGAGPTNVGGTGSQASPFAPDGDTISLLRSNVIEAALNAGTNVYVTTVGTPNKTLQDGTITVTSSITKNAGIASTLFLDAAGSIIVTSGNNITAAVGNVLNVVFNAAKSIFVNGSNITTRTGDVTFTAGDAIEIGSLTQINTAGGDATMTATNGSFFIGNGSAINTAGGDIKVRADGAVSTVLGAPVTGVTKVSGVLNAGGGNIDIHQSAIFEGDADSLRTSGVGTVKVNQNKVGTHGKIQNAIDAIQNTGTGLNTVSIGAGTFKESIVVAEDNFLIKGANYNINPNTGIRGAETIVDPNSPGFHVTGDNVEINGLMITGATGSDGYGIWFEGANNGKASSNIITDTDADGIKTQDGSVFTITENRIDDTRGNGILVSKSGGLIDVSANFIGTGATSAAIDGIWGDGIEIAGVNNNTTVSGNTIANTWDPTKNNTNDNSSGIYLRNSRNIKVTGNIISDTDWDGIKTVNGSGHTLEGNNISGSTRIGIYSENTDNLSVLGNTVHDADLLDSGVITIVGGGSHDIIGNTVSNILGTSTTDAGIKVHYIKGTDNNITGNTIFNIDGDGIRGTEIVDGANIDKNIISLVKGDGIQVTRSTGILHILSNFIGKELEIGGIEGNGIYLTGVNDSFVKENVIWNTKASNPGDGDDASGIYLDNIRNMTVFHNTITGADWDGIKSKNGGGHTIENNDIAHTTRIGIYGENSDNLKVLDNTVYDSNLADSGGITLVGGRDHHIKLNTVHNAVTSTTNSGIKVHYIRGTDNQISDNIIYDIKGDGIHGTEIVEYALISGNDIDDVSGDGIDINDFGSLLVDNNDVRDAGENGILIQNGDYVNVSNNVGLDGTANGVSVVGKNGIKVSHVDDVTVSNNYVDLAGWDGIHVEYFNTAFIAGNRISRSGDDGIEAHNGNQVEIVANNISQSGYGIVDEGEGEEYGGNDEFESGGDGIHVTNIFSGDSYATSKAAALVEEIGTGFIRVTDNTIDVSLDDGIDIDNSQAYVYVAGNTINDSGLFDGTVIHNWTDLTGADGINIENVGQPYYFGDVVREGDAGNGEYNIVVYDNDVTNSLDDGIEIAGNYYSIARSSILASEGDYGDDYYYYGRTGRVLVQDNTVLNSGYGDSVNGYGVGIDGNGGDGIHVRNIYPGYYSEGTVGSIGVGEFAGYAVDILHNSVTNSGDDGIEVIYSESTLIDDNTVKNSGFASSGGEPEGEMSLFVEGNDYGADGIHVRDVGYYYGSDDRVSILADDAELPGYGYQPYSVVIRRNNVDNSQDNGIQVHNDMWYPTAPVLVEINENVSNSGNQGLYISGYNHNNVIVRGNSFSNFDTGGQFESGLIDLTGLGNSWSNGKIGLRFSPYMFSGEGEPYFAYLDLVDNDGAGSTPYPTTPTNFGGTIGSQTFTGFTETGDFYVYLDNGAFTNAGTPIWLNGLNSSYDGIKPSATGGLLTQAQFDFLEARFRHFPDPGASSTDIFWFGFAPDDLIDQSLIFNRFGVFNGDATGLNVRIVSLPFVPGGVNPTPSALNGITTFAGNTTPTDPANLNQIETAAGGDGSPTVPQNLNDIETASGGENESCWGNAVAAASGGQVVSVVYTGGFAANLNQAAACGTGF